MLLSYSEILDINSTIVQIKTEAIPARLALKFVRIARVLDGHVGDFNKVRESIINKHCEKDEDGNPIIVDGNKYSIPDMEGYYIESQELLSEEVEVDVKPLSENDLELLGNISIEAMARLSPIIA